MAAFSESKNHVRETDPETGRDIGEAEAISLIVGAMIRGRRGPGLSQRDPAGLCGIFIFLQQEWNPEKVALTFAYG